MQTEPTTPVRPQCLLTVRDAMARLKVSRRTVEAYITQGKLRRIVLSPRCVRIDPVSLETLAAGSMKKSGLK